MELRVISRAGHRHYACRAWLVLQPTGWGNLAVYAAVLVPSIGTAWALHRFVEVPVERRLRRWKDIRDANRAAAA